MKRPGLHLVLFVATVLSTFATWFYGYGEQLSALDDRLTGAALFSSCVMLILGSHEMGHYLLARHHRVDSSLPYFIPMPLGFGTMGAVIRLRGKIPDRNALVDIGAAGPLAGLLVAIPLFAVGLTLCRVGDAPPQPPLVPGAWSLWSLVPKAIAILRGAPLDLTPTGNVFGDNLLTWSMQQLIIGPLPPGKDLYIHPVLMAAWFGMLVTMLNLMPIGQLDGGHLTHAWFGSRAIGLGKATSVLLLLMISFCTATWVLWFFVTWKLIGYRHPEVMVPEQPLSKGRKGVCALCLVLFVLTLMPVPVGVLA